MTSVELYITIVPVRCTGVQGHYCFLYYYNTISVFVIVIIITYYLDVHGNSIWTTGFGWLKLDISGSDIAYLPGVFQPLYPF